MAFDPTSALALVFVIAVGIAVGTDVTLAQFRRVFRAGAKPFLCGLLAQFGFMPVYVFTLSHLLAGPLEENAQHNFSSAVLGLTIVGCLPGSGTSNLFTYFVGGNLPLSVLMSFVSNVAAFGLLPLLLHCFYDLRFGDDAEAVAIPYLNLILPLMLTVVGTAAGMLLRAKASYDITWWAAKSCTVFSIVFLFLAVLVGLVRHISILTEGDVSFYLCTLSIQPAGYAAGMALAALMKLGLRDQMTIAFETGVQSFSTGMALAQLSFDHDGSEEEKRVFVDVFKFSATCALFYAVHAFWLILLFRKLLPGGHRRLPAVYPQEDWSGYTRRRALAADCSPAACFEPTAPAGSLASLQRLPPTTIPRLFRAAADRHGGRLALAVERPVPPKQADGKAPSLPVEAWRQWSWHEYLADVQRAALALIELRVQPFGSVAILGFNAPEWAIGCMGTIFAGAKVVGIYPTDTADQICFKTQHSNAVVALIEDESKLRRYLEKEAELPLLRNIVTWAVPEEALSKIWSNAAPSVRIREWSQFLQLGRTSMVPTLEKRVEAQLPGHCAVLVYTSGTTGVPKAVMISHDNLVFSSWTWGHLCRDINGVYAGEEMRSLSYLPLSHVAGLFVDLVFPIWTTAKTKGYHAVFFARPYDLKDNTIGSRLRAVRPTLFLGVPRVWEKMAEKLQEAGKRTTGWFCCFRKRTIAAWAKRQGLRTARAAQYGQSGRTSMCYGLAEAIVLKPIKNALGLDECKQCVSAAAPITLETLSYFGSLGITIDEAYGMSESTGVGIASVDRRHLWGSCGFATPGSQVKVLRIDGQGEVPPCADLQNPREEEQGEICFRGRHVMMGYMANPKWGEEHMAETLRQTRAAIDTGGWLHTGDKGCMGRNGMFRITGRFKELIIGAGGENVAPVPMENKIKEVCPGLSNVMMVGDKRKYNTCLVTLQAVGATGELPGGDNLRGLALDVNRSVRTVSAAAQDEAWRGYVEAGIKAANSDPMVCPNNASKIQNFRILPRDFSVQTGELTPTLKLKRAAAAQIWQAKIAEMYPEST